MRDAAGTQVLFETRYFVSSLDPGAVTPGQLARWVRGHWQVENSLHLVKDRWWDEDRHYSSRPGLAERLAGLLNAALTVLRVASPFDEALPLRARADELSWGPTAALKVIGAIPL